MPVSRLLPAAAFLGLFAACASPASAADPPPHHACLTKAEQRAAVASHQAVPLAQAIRTVNAFRHAEVVRARLCRTPKGLAYVLTLLARNGKVTRATVDAANGAIISGR
ncbi:MAG TPA: hypothetical protein VHD14_16110 [Pseudolabrys sp.]|jgi:uncharacterized membrane protein YkoI|nr:hypothetical protein [Pseudolabrys sp.]